MVASFGMATKDCRSSSRKTKDTIWAEHHKKEERETKPEEKKRKTIT
jgi:hypothetical protein